LGVEGEVKLFAHPEVVAADSAFLDCGKPRCTFGRRESLPDGVDVFEDTAVSRFGALVVFVERHLGSAAVDHSGELRHAHPAYSVEGTPDVAVGDAKCPVRESGDQLADDTGGG
jgi:hypothetical protein